MKMGHIMTMPLALGTALSEMCEIAITENGGRAIQIEGNSRLDMRNDHQ